MCGRFRPLIEMDSCYPVQWLTSLSASIQSSMPHVMKPLDVLSSRCSKSPAPLFLPSAPAELLTLYTHVRNNIELRLWFMCMLWLTALLYYRELQKLQSLSSSVVACIPEWCVASGGSTLGPGGTGPPKSCPGLQIFSGLFRPNFSTCQSSAIETV